MTEDQTNNSDLSAGEISQEQKFLGEILLMEASQKSKFKNFSFYGSWILSFIFFLTVVIFSWSIMFCPNVFITPKEIKPFVKNEIGETMGVKETPAHINSVQSTSSAQNISESKIEKSSQGSLINQFLIMLGLLSAVGTTLAIAVMRFSFSNEKANDKVNDATPISPIASSVAEFIKQITELLKHSKN